MRKWEKTDKEGRILAKVKGRDYFDLMWYLEKKVKPNFDCFKDIRDIAELKRKLLSAVEKVDSRSIIYDLEPLIADQIFVKKLGKNLKNIIKKELENL
jgi:hypothetical protein